ncbi:MAG: DUF3617 domain-containing protein [Betaproteobacteria bacterium HGW-Betaproteobacteria-3]|jgi:hypothetical protein|nr:MAG: DUF3617 domain-containing protein [Betaproteobacteria bacterium HGW-Betaproteobacteria-3]
MTLVRGLQVAAQAFVVGVVFAAPVWGQSQKPGLWEITQRMSGSAEMDQAMAQMQQQLAGMSPQQRKAMEDMMGRQGVTMGVAPGAGMALKVCMTREMIERNEMPSQTEGDCKTTQNSRSGNTLKISFVCTRPPSTGEGSYTFSGDTGFTSRMKITTPRNGKPETVTMTGAGKWLAADCGTVKPVAPPKK